MNTLSQRHVPFEAAGPDLIEGQARVVAVDGAMVWLATLAPAACGSCATNAACGTAAQQAPTTPATPSTQWRVPRSLPAGGTPLALGDTVRVGVDRRALTRAAWVAYTLPLLAMVAAAVGAAGAGDAVAAGAALAGLLLGALAARQLVRRWQTALQPVVLGRALAAGCGPATVPLQQLQRPLQRPLQHPLRRP